MKPQSGQRKRTLRQLGDFVEYSAGGDVVGVFNAYFETRRGKGMCTKQKFLEQIPQYKNLMKVLLRAFCKSELYEQRQWLSIMRASGFSGSELRRMDWQFSKRAWTETTRHSIRTYPVSPVCTKIGVVML